MMEVILEVKNKKSQIGKQWLDYWNSNFCFEMFFRLRAIVIPMKIGKTIILILVILENNIFRRKYNMFSQISSFL